MTTICCRKYLEFLSFVHCYMYENITTLKISQITVCHNTKYMYPFVCKKCSVLQRTKFHSLKFCFQNFGSKDFIALNVCCKL